MQVKKILLPVLAFLTFHNAIAQDKEEQAKFGHNIIAFSPLMVCAPGVGFGVSYEHVLDKKGIAALYLPISFSKASGNSNPYYYTGPTQNYYTGFFMPGLKFYPTGHNGKVKYAIGPSIAAVLGSVPTSTWDPLTYQIHNATKTRFSLGTMVFNSLNINPTDHLHMGIEMGIGVSYIDQLNGRDTYDAPALFQLGLKIGYRY